MVLWGQLQTLGGALLNGLERAVDLLAPVAGEYPGHIYRNS